MPTKKKRVLLPDHLVLPDNAGGDLTNASSREPSSLRTTLWFDDEANAEGMGMGHIAKQEKVLRPGTVAAISKRRIMSNAFKDRATFNEDIQADADEMPATLPWFHV